MQPSSLRASFAPLASFISAAFFLLAAGTAGAATQAGAAYTFNPTTGQTLYDNTCAACHQATGMGVPTAFPPLKGNPAINDADPTVQIQTILYGKHGVVIQGVDYKNTAMPAFGGQLSDVDIANIINHERTSWGNQGKPVTPDQVAAVRAKGN